MEGVLNVQKVSGQCLKSMDKIKKNFLGIKKNLVILTFYYENSKT